MGSCSSSGLVDELQQWLILSLLWSMVITSIGSLTCKKYELCDTRDGSLVYSDFCSCREPRFISQNPHGGLPIPINSSFWPPRALPIYMVCKHMCKPTLIHIKIIAKKFKRRNTDSWAPHGMPTTTLFYKIFYGGSQTWGSYEPQPNLLTLGRVLFDRKIHILNY